MSPASEQRLLDIVLPQGGYVVAMMEAYFGESGSHGGSPILVVAGYLIESGSAKSMTAEWNRILANNGLSHFHMADCAHGAGEFAGCPVEKRVEIQTLLIELIKRNITRGFGASVVMDEYTGRVPDRPDLVDPYGFCIWGCVEDVRQWTTDANYDGDVAYFFESGHGSERRVNAHMRWVFEDDEVRRDYRYLSHTFICKRKYAMVQAADLLAWQFFTDRKHLINGRKRRKDYLSLVSQSDHRTAHADPVMIAQWVEMMDGGRRAIIHPAPQSTRS